MADHDRHTDAALEEIMRAGLAARAGEAPRELAHPAAAPRAPRRTAWLTAGVAAACVLVGVPLTWQLLDDGGRQPSGELRPPATDAPAGDTGEWRVESYGGVQVRVPPDWGWGGAWFTSEGRVLDCGAGPFVAPGSPDYEFVPDDTPYVGRPVMMTDACSIPGLANAPAPPPPAADSVWLGAAVEPGTEDLADGYVRETVPVGDSVVTVTSDDPELRATILATAEAVDTDDNGCRADATWPDFPDGPLPAAKPASLSVCAYSTFRGETTMVWSERRGAARAAEYAELVEESTALYDPNRLCTEQPEGEWLAIGVNGPDGETAWTAAVMGECAQILWHYEAVDEPESLASSPVVPRTVAPWASPSVRAYVAGPSDWSEYAGEDGDGIFRGYLG